ncbi:hypothetical protein [Bradyrhizobium sp. USDA 3364]
MSRAPAANFRKARAAGETQGDPSHLWHERRLLNPIVFFSDELQAEMTRWGLRVPAHHRLNAI